ncbi:hypothetical protein OS493_019338 [Desmophyllum pertusum]|uniref:Uncharacterized protein n=1 Tax=Desmophyllum pertusum TaxID=174260 RepID=A0A9X0A0G7_9CNID|nr:hypothetical protein OS493_019338 [Desmophyllum pertusum]
MVAKLGKVENRIKADIRQALCCKINSIKFRTNKPRYFQDKEEEDEEGIPSSPFSSGVMTEAKRSTKETITLRQVDEGKKKSDLPMYPNASFRKLKIYSSAEIAQSNPLEKICHKKLNKWKASALHGVLDTAWTSKKSMLLVL